MRIRAFQGLRPSKDAVNEVVSLPYDVVSTEEVRELIEGKPNSMLRVVRADGEFPDGTDPYADEVYARAVANFHRMQENGSLVREDGPKLYIYQQRMGDHTQRGLVAVCHVDDYANDVIRKHEKTRVAKENDRTRLTSDMSANAGPVFLTYRDHPEVTGLVDEAVAGEPLYDLTTPDGIQHTVWPVSSPDRLVELFAGIPFAYVADGHHRSASAARVGAERRAANPGHTGEEDYNWFLSVLFPASELKILPYNRLVHDLNGQGADEVLAAIREQFPVAEADGAEPSGVGDIRMFLAGRWWRIDVAGLVRNDPVADLDVSRLQDHILDPILGIDDPRTSDRIEFVGGIRGTAYLEKAVTGGKAAVAFSLYPVLVEQLMAIADAGQIMAPKSTWFEPKLRSGFFIHTF